jgi:hypothetical protein
MHKMAQTAAHPAEWRATCCRKYDRSWQVLERILKREREWEAAVHVKDARRGKKPAEAKRKAGAGRKDAFARQKVELKAWLEQ